MDDHEMRGGPVAPGPTGEIDQRHQSTTRRPAWVRFHFATWEILRLRLSADEIHAYLTLFCESSYYGGRLRMPISAIAKRTKLDPQDLGLLIAGHPELFESEGDDLIVIAAATELSRAEQISKQRAAAGRRSGEVRRLRIVDAGGAGDD